MGIASHTYAHWLMKMASMASELLRLGYSTLEDPVRLASALRQRLFERDFASSSGRIKWRDLVASLDFVAKRQLALPETQHVADRELLKAQLTRALSGRSVTHPLRWMIWCSNWFDDLRDLKAAYDRADKHRSTTDALPVHEVASHGPEAWQTTVLDQVRTGAVSMTRGAKLADVSYNTFAAWACALGIEAARRPQKVNADVRQCISIRLLAGEDKANLASEFRLSMETLTRILRTTPGLREARNRSRFERRRIAARQEWHELLASDPCLTTKAARSIAPAAYTWLYRNDREWLKSSSPVLKITTGTNHALQKMKNKVERRSKALRQLLDLST